ncbi:MAG TPA: hypothetical protein VLW50_00025 [Streptosporangiaceae bacterium]|nr:hypothetical protein [Streptosporangiaceae bacterium]
MVEDVGLVRGKNVVAVIDFRQTTIYPTDASHYWVANAEKHRRDVAAKSPTCGLTSIIWMTRRCYGWRSTTLPRRP